MVIPEGRVMIGRFGGVEPWQRADGTAISGGFVLTLVQTFPDGGTRDMRVRFFERGFEGDPTAFALSLRRMKPSSGELVGVRFTTTASVRKGTAYVNDEPQSVVLLEREAPAMAEAD